MTDTSPAPFGQKPPLGLGQIIGDSFSLFFSRFGTFYLLAFVPQVIVAIVSALLIGNMLMSLQAGTANPENMLGMFTSPAFIITTILSLVVYGVVTALMVLAAYDAKTGHPSRIGTYVSIAMSRIVPVLIVTLIVGIAVYIGLVLLIVPGLWVMAVLSCAVTVVVLESLGIGASLSRSAELTQEYRWPIVGTIVVIYLIMVVVSIVLSFVTGALAGVIISTLGPTIGIIVFQIIQAAVGALTTAVIAIAFVLIYARLREIKEGVGIDSLQDVFR